MKIGLLSDTHGLLRLEALAALAGVDAIVHAGDVGDPGILVALAEVAPLYAIRGNIDTQGPCAALPERLRLDFAGLRLLVVHALAEAGKDPDADIVVCGHSHIPKLAYEAGRHWVNPGAAGKRRFQLPISLALLHIAAGVPRFEFINLLDARPLP
jgi:uncharacterized protein